MVHKLAALTWMTAAGSLMGAACQFNANNDSDGNTVAIVIGFPSATLLQDESSGSVLIPVTLSAATDEIVTVRYAVTGGSATSGDDYLSSDGMLTFLPQSTELTFEVTIVADGAEETDETIELALSSPTGGTIGLGNQTLTISANILPRVTFASPTQGMTEGDNPGASTVVTTTIMLDTTSARDVTVDVAASGMATNGVDYNLSATSVTIPAGQLSTSVSVSVVGDTSDEPDEDVALTMSVATPPAAIVGTTSVHTVTIQDDDLACYGTGTSAVCFDRGPTTPTTLPAAIDTGAAITGTGASADCAAAQPSNWAGQGQSRACFIVGSTITMAGATTVVTGGRPLVLVASDSINIAGLLDVASHQPTGTSGPASGSPCAAFGATPGDSANGGGGGAGGSFMSKGGDGGTGDGTSIAKGTAGPPFTVPPLLRAGCSGQKGGNGSGGAVGGSGGPGGGAIYVVCGSTITVAGTINASGAGGNLGQAPRAAGGGGGSGGMIVLYAPNVITTTAKLMANGGGGGQGADNGTAGFNGNDPSTTTPTVATTGGNRGGAGGAGGAGFAGAALATNGSNGGGNEGAGAGGGGGGYIRSNVALSGTRSAGLIEIIP